MAELTISSTTQNKYVISGCVDALLKNKRAKLMMRNQLPYVVEDDNIVVSSEETIDHVAKILKVIAGYIGAEVKYDDKINADIAEFRLREELFNEFSHEAESI